MTIQSVLIDSREPGWVQGLAFGGVPKSVMALDTGDLWIATADAMLIVERKTPGDLLHTLAEGRLLPQCLAMVERSPWCYLVITGPLFCGGDGKVWLDQRSTGWDFAAVQGALLTVQELGAGVVYADGDGDFEATITRLAHRKRDAIRIRPPRDARLQTSGEQLLAALPGVGAERVSALLTYCGTPAWALVYLCDEQLANAPAGVPGIGPATKAATRKALGLEDWAELQISVKEQNDTQRQETNDG